ncbi:MAG: hypothetical protein HY320_07720 [Armatimonadetes bacterium]|nr:hypothetical protein [Armatimonadota bacterium]
MWKRRSPAHTGPEASGHPVGRARVDARTKQLCLRLQPGEVAIIDHEDLDATAATALADLRPAAVVNAARSMTGRYPNLGPSVLLAAGIPILDEVGSATLARVQEGRIVEVRHDGLYADGQRIAEGRRLDPGQVEAALQAGRENLAQELRRFTENTLRYLEKEQDLAFQAVPLPPLKTRIRGRPVLVVVRGYGYREDLAATRLFIRNEKPVLIAVDGGADALLESGLKPDLLVGDMDSSSVAALKCGAELVVHTYADGRPSPGLQRVESLGLPAHTLAFPGTSEDVALLLAHQAGAELIVAVGTHFSLVEFLDKRRPGMASTFLTRLRIGSLLVDAKGVSRLYRPALSLAWLAGLLGSAALCFFIIYLHSPTLQSWLRAFGMSLEIWLRRHGLR